ncbi:serine hydrolase [Pelagibius sp. Alg239-R121]|uniref:serine hydrolase domain-containing protein n=1 Tax=Pelagibius sp. Alg239-R121 TaxID=2993448 RepID=UPI0024A74380|nr:serine hydrolase domain-containing protein [Pelagibius sp. Alg239-R121]
MKKSRRIGGLSRLAVIVICCAIINPLNNLQARVEMPSVEDTREAERARLASFEADIAGLYVRLPIAGMAAGLLRGNDLSWFKGYGYADLAMKRRVTPDTPFHLASLTKTFASTLLLQLGEQGRLDLDTPAADFGIKLESRGTITLRHLFSHTSHDRPGEDYRYDGSRFAQLDRVIEQITGRSFEVYLNNLIVGPLDLKNTGRMGGVFEVPPASPYKLNDAGDLVPGAYKTYFGSAAGLVASIADYAKYLTAVKNNRFLRPETQALAFTPAKSTVGHDLPYGLGWFVESVKGTKVIWHYGYWDSVSTLVVMLPDKNLSFFAFANTDALSRGFNLGNGRILESPAAAIFLEHFLFDVE